MTTDSHLRNRVDPGICQDGIIVSHFDKAHRYQCLQMRWVDRGQHPAFCLDVPQRPAQVNRLLEVKIRKGIYTSHLRSCSVGCGVEASSWIQVYATPQSREFKQSKTLQSTKKDPAQPGAGERGYSLRLGGAAGPRLHSSVALIGIGKHFRVILQRKQTQSKAERSATAIPTGTIEDRRSAAALGARSGALAS
jgi:hypothetical protein